MPRNNLTREERTALLELSTDPRIIIKPADKGSCVVIMDREAYIKEAHRQLHNSKYYISIPAPIFKHTIPLINNTLQDMLVDGAISQKQYDFLRATGDDRPRQFYILPKIHKPRDKWPSTDMPEGRPIVSDTGSESYRVAKFINSFIRPISMSHPSFIKDTYDFVSKIRDIKIYPNTLLVTGDVTALYTNMAFERTMNIVKQALSKHPCPRRPDDHILKLLELTMTRNDFEFHGNYYLQTCGMAMGKTYAPALADLYMLEIDEYMRNWPLQIHYRFLDDIFFTWEHSEQALITFQDHINSIIPGIAITLHWSKVSVNFLDTTIYRFAGLNGVDTIRTRVYFKDTDTHQLLHKKSFHPNHTYKGVLKSQLIRFKRISSTEDDYNHTCHILFHTLSKRGYPRSLMRKLKRDIWKTQLQTSSNPVRNADQPAILPIIVPYNKLGTGLARGWRTAIVQNQIYGTSRPIIAYMVGHNLKHHLVQSRINLPINQFWPVVPNHTLPGECITCDDPKCKTCPILETGRTFSSHISSRSFGVMGQITCKTSNLIYLINCNACHKQYVGETGRKLCERVCDHRSNILLRKKTPIARHFNLPNHSLAHFKIMGIHALLTQTGSHARKTLESNYQHLLHTLAPNGINNS
ncbi:hypothetical protein HC928_09700 [bacterium]|nr:hypothetical protein [bacterium]